MDNQQNITGNQGSRILVIDDDIDILELLELLLSEEGYTPVLRNCGITTSEVAEIGPRLILLDVCIQGYHETGDKICTRLKMDPRTNFIPIILVSAEANLGFLARNCSADAYISKPFNIQTIIEKAEKLIPLS